MTPRALPLSPRMAWEADPYADRPVLASLRPAGSRYRDYADFPSVSTLSALLEGRRSAGGAALVFEAQGKKARVTRLEETYDGRIYREGRIPTRPHSFHDYFNALVWGTFPHAKRAVNARQYAALVDVFAREGRLPGARTREQDALAMLDEGGILILSTPARLDATRELVKRGDAVSLAAASARGDLCALLFGHALAEHVVSSTARVRGLPICLAVSNLERSLGELVSDADFALAQHLERALLVPPGTPALALDEALFAPAATR